MEMYGSSPAAGWSWLKSGFSVADKDASSVLGASALLLLCAVLIAVAQRAVGLNATSGLALRVVAALASGLVLPILMGGFMRLIDANRRGRPVSAWMVFQPFQSGPDALRLALFGLCMTLVYLAFLLLVMSTVGHSVLLWSQQVAAMKAHGASLRDMPPLPHAFGPTMFLFTLFYIFYGGAMAIGIGQVALQNETPLAAIRDGAIGVVKNVLPLFVLAICGFVTAVVLTVILAIVLLIAGMLAGLISHALATALPFAILLVAMLPICACVMGVNYAVWNEVTNG